MKKLIKKLLIVPSILLLIALAILVKNRYSFGVWNPFSLPDRVQCYSRRYYISTSSPNIFNENEKPTYSISFTDNKTGKDLYTQYPKGQYVPTVIYLKLNDGKYQSYVLSGGP